MDRARPIDPNQILPHQRTLGFGTWEEFHAFIADTEGTHYRHILDERPFSVHLRKASSGAVAVAVATVSTSMEVSTERLRHATYLLQFPITMQLQVEVDGRALCVQGGEALLLSPGMHVRRVNTPGSILLMRIDSALIDAVQERRLGRPCPEPARFEPHVRDARSLLEYCLILYDAIDRGVAQSGAPVSCALEIALAELLLAEVPSDRSAELDAVEAAQLSRRMAAVTEFIERNLARPLAVGELAEHAHTSVRSLQEAFARHQRMSPVQYIRQRRLARARELLEQADVPASIAEVAQQVGIAHLGRFAAWYRETYGETPSQTLARAQQGTRARDAF